MGGWARGWVRGGLAPTHVPRNADRSSIALKHPLVLAIGAVLGVLHHYDAVTIRALVVRERRGTAARRHAGVAAAAVGRYMLRSTGVRERGEG